jgi:hypothetical protein
MQQSAGSGSVIRDNTHGLWAGGSFYTNSAYANNIERVTIAAAGNNLTDYGDLSTGRGWAAGAGSSSRGIIMGGKTVQTTNGQTDTIEYKSVSSVADASNFNGILTDAREELKALSNETRAIAGAGSTGQTGSGNQVSTADYITIAAASNAADFGNLVYAARGRSGTANSSRGLFSGGWTFSGGLATYPIGIDVVTISSTSSAADFGDDVTYGSTSIGRAGIMSASNETRALWMGGGTNLGSGYDRSSHSTIASNGNALQFSQYFAEPTNPTNPRADGEGVANDTRAVFMGGSTPQAALFVTIMSESTVASPNAGNATIFGYKALASNFNHCASFAGLG